MGGLGRSELGFLLGSGIVVERGVWIRPFGTLIYVMPPYVTEPADVTALTDAIHWVVRDVHGPAVAGSP